MRYEYIIENLNSIINKIDLIVKDFLIKNRFLRETNIHIILLMRKKFYFILNKHKIRQLIFFYFSRYKYHNIKLVYIYRIELVK